MGTYFLVAFLILYGITNLVSTSIPNWVLGVVALATALAMLIGDRWKKP